MRKSLAILAAALLSGCVTPVSLPGPELPPAANAGPGVAEPLAAETAARNFLSVASAMEPVIERECSARNRQAGCDFQIVVDDRPNQPANAFQTLDRAGRPVIAFTLALIADARNADELAFVMGHEAAHHILSHIPKSQEQAMVGALLLGTIASLGGGSAASVEAAQKVGASVGARRFSKGFELEADQLGTVIAWDAGFDPERGAQFFDRLADPGDSFLGTHPPNADRKAVVRATLAGLRGF